MRLSPTRLLWGAALALAAGTAPAAAAPKTDVIVLRNGDRITCEIDLMERGSLCVKTDDMGTLNIEWDKIASLRADATFEIEDVVGAQYYGALREGPRDGALRLESPASVHVLDMLAVVRVSRMGRTFWNRLDGAIDLTTSYTSASELFTLDLAGEVVYERPRYEIGFDVSSTLTRQPGVDDTRRWNGTLNAQQRRPGRWFRFGQGLLEQNRELGFSLRGSLAAGAGRYFVQSLHDDLMGAAGLSVSREVPVDGDATTNPELLLSLQYSRVRYDFPKIDILVSLTAFESLDGWGRTRVEADARLRREILKDFNLTLRAYESYDSEPATEGAALHDYGFTFGFGYTF
jgi:hypothetical protein